jgi:ABC-type transporter Mla maintaining outer membrane lipid asymmetry ATPase subunit MlaF
VLIDFQDVHKAFGPKKVLQGASFQIRRGEAVGVIGGSGTGKSTTLRLIAGLLQPDAGKVMVNGKERLGLISDGEEASYKLKLGLVFQNAALFDSLSVMENVGFQLYEHSHLEPEEIERLVIENLAKVGLHGVEHLSPSQLSGGMKKRVALARVRRSRAACQLRMFRFCRLLTNATASRRRGRAGFPQPLHGPAPCNATRCCAMTAHSSSTCSRY